MPDNFNTEAKKLIRSEWSKKIIKFIKEELNVKFVYLGLPSPDPQDVYEWIEYIDKVIAFQCREYPKPSESYQSDKDIKKLQEKLSELERKKLISNYIVYDGYIEEVLLNRKDNVGVEFQLNELVHIFNLDFCNKITSPIKIVDKNGDVVERYKFDAIKTLLQLQEMVKINPKKFILFLTIHSSYEGKELDDFTSEEKYKNEINKLPKPERKPRILRSYVMETLRDYFKVNNFIPEFLPVISYTGLSKHKLLHFTVIGTSKKGKTGAAPFNQTFSHLIRQKFITIKNNGFAASDIDKIKEKEIKTDPIANFTNSKTYKKLWLKS
jgi:hypothetical protein